MTETNTTIDEQLELSIKLESIFSPASRAKRDALYNHTKRAPARFVHYTSAEAALNIIKTKRLWMRNATCMSDYKEVQHGFEMLNIFFTDQAKKAEFEEVFDACFPGITKEAIGLFNSWWNDIQFNTYITSISEHDDSEDLHGRLSMWRAFGGNSARIALVFNVPWSSKGAEALGIQFNPVSYMKQDDVYKELEAIFSNVRENRDFLNSLDRQIVLNNLFYMLVNSVTCLKHEGFREEREWRIIYAPMRRPSPLIERETTSVGGIPQIVHKIPLDENASPSLSELEFARIFDRLIIGPTQFPLAIYEAFVDALNSAGVSNAQERVYTSGIPLRI